MSSDSITTKHNQADLE